MADQLQLDRTGCLGNTIKVGAGHYFDLLNPSPASVDIRSIAGALSKMCRFGGHCPQFYSVAEHCIHATVLASGDGVRGDALTAIFLHDAAEAYVGDMVKPLKALLPDYGVAERRIEAAVEIHFGVSFTRHKDVIKHYDMQMLKAEKIAMWPQDAEQWTGFGEIENRTVRFGFWSPQVAETLFLLTGKTVGLEC